MRQIGKLYSLRKARDDPGIKSSSKVAVRIDQLIKAMSNKGWTVKSYYTLSPSEYDYTISNSEGTVGEIHFANVSVYGDSELEEFLSKYRVK